MVIRGPPDDRTVTGSLAGIGRNDYFNNSSMSCSNIALSTMPTWEMATRPCRSINIVFGSSPAWNRVSIASFPTATGYCMCDFCMKGLI